MPVEKFERGKKYQVKWQEKWHDASDCYPYPSPAEDWASFPVAHKNGYECLCLPKDSEDVRLKPKGRYKITFEDLEEGGEAIFWADGYELGREYIDVTTRDDEGFANLVPGPTTLTAQVR